MGLGRSVALSRSLAGSAEGACSPALLAPNEWAVALRRLSQETGLTLVAASAGLSRRFDAPAQPFWDLSSQSGLNVCAPSPCCPAPPFPALAAAPAPRGGSRGAAPASSGRSERCTFQDAPL
jgi:hypothetical protein